MKRREVLVKRERATPRSTILPAIEQLLAKEEERLLVAHCELREAGMVALTIKLAAASMVRHGEPYEHRWNVFTSDMAQAVREQHAVLLKAVGQERAAELVQPLLDILQQGRGTYA